MIYKWTEEQKQVLSRISLSFDPFGEVAENDLFEFENKVADYLQEHGLENDNVNAIGRICESILDIVTDY